MKKILLFLFLCPISLFAQNAFSDDFESYTTTDFIGAQNQWRTWSGTPMGADDILVGQTMDANSLTTNALHFTSAVAAGGPTDILWELGGPYNTGEMTIKFDYKGDANKDGYINFQGANTTGTFHSNVFFETNGDVIVTAGNGGEILKGSYNQTTWNEIKFVVNLNSNAWELFVNNVSQGTYQTETYAIAMINFYPTSNTSGFWIDNVSYTYTPFTLPNRNAALSILGIDNGLATQQREVAIKVRNLGTTAITAFDLTVTTNSTPINQSVTGVNIASNTEYSFIMTSPVTLATGLNTFTGTISNVNGTAADDYASDDSKSISFTTVTPATDKMVVGEEATGTWCQWCPRGDVALREMDKKYPGFFQGIAVHNGDPMAVTVYDQGMNTKINGYPSGLVDRQVDVDPSEFETNFLTRITIPSIAKLKNGATYNAASGELNVSVEYDFVTAATGNYKVLCVIIEDSVKGTTSGYNQSNAYAGGGSGVMGGYELLPSVVPAAQMTYRHVARAINPSFAGISNAFPASVSAADKFVHNFNFSIKDYKKEQIHIVGMLIDPSGKIDNASSTTVDEALANGFVVSTKNVSFEPELINIYPNPTQDELNILVQDIKDNGASQFQVIDLNGKIIMKQEVNLIKGANRTKLSVTGLAAGTYILRLNNQEGGAYTTTFSKK